MRTPLPPARTAAPARAGVPFMVLAVVYSTALAFLGTVTLFGYRTSGWAWVIPLSVSALVLLARWKEVSFPVVIWVPWIVFLGVHLANTEFPALQRTLQVLTPIAIATALSSLRLEDLTLGKVRRALRWFTLFIAVALLVRSGAVMTLQLPHTTSFAAESMTATLLAVAYGVEYFLGNPGALRWWLGMVGVTIFSVTRTEIAAAVLSLPLCLVRIGAGRRLRIIALVGLLGLGLFSTERLQRKMFESATGEIGDVFGEEFRDSGRFSMWKQFRERVAEKPWLGHGTGAGERYARSITNGQLQYPHNDWLLTAFDHGYAGVFLYAATLLAATVHAARAARAKTGAAQTFLLTGASAFLPYAVLMYGDNAMAYVSYFGNFQFLLLGLGYAAGRPPLVAAAAPRNGRRV